MMRKLMYSLLLLLSIQLVAQPDLSMIFYLDENSPNGTLVGTVTATDPDMDMVSFSIVSGNEDGAFAIDADDGHITVSNQSLLDFEMTPTFEFLVEADDGNGGMTSVGITIHLQNVSEPVLGINDHKERIIAYPNPVEEILTVEIDQLHLKNPEILIYSLGGHKMQLNIQFIAESKVEIDFRSVDQGIYVLMIASEDHFIFQRRVFVK